MLVCGFQIVVLKCVSVVVCENVSVRTTTLKCQTLHHHRPGWGTKHPRSLDSRETYRKERYPDGTVGLFKMVIKNGKKLGSLTFVSSKFLVYNLYKRSSLFRFMFVV